MYRSMNIKSLSVAVSALVLSTSVNAVVLNTLNGVDYQWLELAETQGLSRDAVEFRLADDTDALYGYEYATRQLVEDLFLSYTTWDLVDGRHGNPSAVSGASNLFSDFGATSTDTGGGTNRTWTTVDGFQVLIDGEQEMRALYGAKNECGTGESCRSALLLYTDAAGDATAVWQEADGGWDATHSSPQTRPDYTTSSGTASFLVRDVTVVPVPAAIWLFGSGLIGLIGIARRKKA